MYKSFIYSLITLVCIFSACSKSTDIQPKKLITTLEKISEKSTDDGSLLIEVYSLQKLSTGYNPLYFRILDSNTNQSYSEAEISFTPMMSMHMDHMELKHSAPFERPSTISMEDDLFKAASVFTMASDEHGQWDLEIDVKTAKNVALQKVLIPVHVNEAKDMKIKTIELGETNYIVTYIQPSLPKIGINEFEVVIHQKKSAMEFPSEDGFVIKIDTEMPSMGHGSPNNINPTLTSNGHYKGKVNFTMTGDWRIHLDLTKGQETVKSSFDLIF